MKIEYKTTRYNYAVYLYNKGDYTEASEAFKELDGYRDSDEYLAKIGNRTEPNYKASVGDILLFGSYEQDNNPDNGTESIEWIVLDENENGMLIMSKYALHAMRFAPMRDYIANVLWEDSDIRSWLNDDFYNSAFSESEKSEIITSKVTADRNPNYSILPGEDTNDRVFLLSIIEANKYLDTDDLRQCKATDSAKKSGLFVYNNGSVNWWLRTPGNDIGTAATVLYDGTVSCEGGQFHSKVGIRPAIWIKTK